MSLPTVQESYSTKSPEYFQALRPEMLNFVPIDCKRALDVGCAQGIFGESLKRLRGLEVYGVEPTRTAAALATERLDHVFEGYFGPELPIPSQHFDCIIFNDVLEHMTDPEAAIRYAKTLLRPGGVVVASIPNIAYIPVLRDLIFRDQWEYTDSGTLDRTHLRFFTRSSIRNLFEREGFALDSIQGINEYSYPGPFLLHHLVWKAFKVTDRILRNRFEQMVFMQFAVVARPCELGTAK